MANQLLKELLLVHKQGIVMIVHSYEEVKGVRKTFGLGKTRWDYITENSWYPKHIGIIRNDSNNLEFHWANSVGTHELISISPLELVINQIRYEIYELH